MGSYYDIVQVQRKSAQQIAVSTGGSSSQWVLNGAACVLDREDAEGGIRYVVGAEVTRPDFVCVSSNDGTSAALLDGLPRRSDAAAVEKLKAANAAAQPIPLSEGAIAIDGIVVTVTADGKRWDFVHLTAAMPGVVEAQRDGENVDVLLSMSSDTKVRLRVDVDTYLKAKAIFRHGQSSSESGAVVRKWVHKAVAGVKGKDLMATLTSHGNSGWELVDITSEQHITQNFVDKYTLVFKRLK